MTDRTDKFIAGPDSFVFPQCAYCRHATPSHFGQAACKAFPNNIPQPIRDNAADHRKPYPGDEGMGTPGEHVLFEPRPDIPPEVLASLYATLDALR